VARTRSEAHSPVRLAAVVANGANSFTQFRNLAAHPEDIRISRDDAEDLQTFVNAIVDYVYDLADRYEEFKSRVDARAKRKKS
jgi:hypothetical protein